MPIKFPVKFSIQAWQRDWKMALEIALLANSMATISGGNSLNFPAFFPVTGNLSENGSLWEILAIPQSSSQRKSALPFHTNGPESVSKMGQKCSLFTLFARNLARRTVSTRLSAPPLLLLSGTYMLVIPRLIPLQQRISHEPRVQPH